MPVPAGSSSNINDLKDEMSYGQRRNANITNMSWADEVEAEGWGAGSSSSPDNSNSRPKRGDGPGPAFPKIEDDNHGSGKRGKQRALKSWADVAASKPPSGRGKGGGGKGEDCP